MNVPLWATNGKARKFVLRSATPRSRAFYFGPICAIIALMKDILSKKQLEQLGDIAKKYRIADVYIFGSRIEGFARKDSDLDIGVRFIDGLPNGGAVGKIYGNLASEIQSLFRGYSIDLVLIDEAKLHFQYKVIAKGKLIFSADYENSCNFAESIANRYRDYKYFIDDFFEGIRIAPIS